ncbi:hypothetical protein Droror1_Dr00001610 [Drosera rotundifolia]
MRTLKSHNNPRPPLPSRLLRLTLIPLSLLLLVFLLSDQFPLYRSPAAFAQLRQCGGGGTLGQWKRFLLYAPHSGFGNQVSEFKNAILMAGILNRTLIVPPVMDHGAVALGSCPKFRVLGAGELRLKAWEHAVELLRDGRYISLTSILDISSLASEIQTIEFRDFVSLWCGVDLSHVCSTDSNTKSSALDTLLQCGSQLSGLNGTVNDCLYTVDEDCRSTVWTYGHKSEEDGSLDSFQPDEQLRAKKKISFIRRRLDVYKRLGPGSKAHSATLVAFGSLFTAKYKGSELLIDIHESRVDHRIQLLIERIGFIPFIPVITEAGKKYSSKIMSPFLCAQLRLLDGQFKNHWKTTFSYLREKVESLKEGVRTRPIHIFIMTDLPPSNWSGTYLWELARDVNSFKLHLMSEDINFVMTTTKKVASFAFDMRLKTAVAEHNYYCSNGQLPDILLYLEETVCACSSLGFVGTAGSTIAESIEQMRRNAVCAR